MLQRKITVIVKIVCANTYCKENEEKNYKKVELAGKLTDSPFLSGHVP